MADEEKIYVIPLRRIFSGFPKYKRANKALRGVREYLEKHLKTDKIRIGKGLNDEIWKHGIKEPPHHVKVSAKKDKDGIVSAELFGYVDRKAKREEDKLKSKEAKTKLKSQKKEVAKDDSEEMTKSKIVPKTKEAKESSVNDKETSVAKTKSTSKKSTSKSRK
ncbi:MAG TPA: 50S ribosomal protein L31e [Candidatus Woesearchaeota archaeon]|nr:50S ribosomal protein L31e [Candidatus Woesearchaeota archaeon]